MHELIIKSKEIKEEGGGELAKSGTKFWRKGEKILSKGKKNLGTI